MPNKTSGDAASPDLNAQEINLRDFQQILTLFGVDANQIAEKLTIDQQKKLIKIFTELQPVTDSLKQNHQLTSYAMINWIEVLAELDEEGQSLDLDMLFSKWRRPFNSLSKKADPYMTYVYLGCNLLGFMLSALSIANVNLGVMADSASPHNIAIGSGWNYGDSIAGAMIGIHQIQNGEVGMGLVNLFSSTQCSALTITANVSSYSSALNLGAATAGAFMGFSFAACMLISFGIEMYEVSQCNKRIRSLKRNLTDIEARLDDDPSNPNLIAQRDSYQKTILIEMALRENHKRNAKAWAVCAVAMTAIAVVGYITLSGMSFGALPALTLAFALLALASAKFRAWVGQKNSVDNVKAALKPDAKNSPQPLSLIQRLNKAIAENKLGLEFDNEITIPGFFKNRTMSLKSYLENMAVNDPGKLECLVFPMEKGNSVAFYRAARLHRTPLPCFGGFGKTTGIKLLELLNKEQASDLAVSRGISLSPLPSQ